MQLARHRTALAAVLTLVAIAVPCGSWFVAGRREVEREAHTQEKWIYTSGFKRAVKITERLATRLEVLRETESRRPFYHYQNLYHDPRGAAEGAAVAVSPLAAGPADSLIEAHFQIDEDGALTMPTVNEQFPELGSVDHHRAQCALQERLDQLAAFCSRETLEAGEAQALLSGPHDRDLRPAVDLPLRQDLPRNAWQQHLRANALYAGLKYARTAHGSRPLPLGPAESKEKVAIEVGPFRWHSLPAGGEPALVALRPVTTPSGLWIQGFLIDTAAARQLVEQDTGDGEPRAVLGPERLLEATRCEASVIVPIETTPWAIAVDVSAPLADAAAKARARLSRFHRSFALGSLAALVAGLLVVGIVYQADDLAQQRARFAASAAHELRTPLAGLRLYGEMLAEGLGNPSRARDYARRLAAEAERLGRVVTNVLSFTRLEHQKLALHPVAGDLAAAVREEVERQRPALEEAGARLDLALPPTLPPVAFDRDALSHIVQNLLDNAEKYSREVEGRTIRVGLVAEDGHVRLSVEDNGPGVGRKLRGRLFRPFARGLHGDGPEGLGLGLVLVRELARGQGGDVTYHDVEPHGAAFVVTLPA